MGKKEEKGKRTEKMVMVWLIRKEEDIHGQKTRNEKRKPFRKRHINWIFFTIGEVCSFLDFLLPVKSVSPSSLPF